MIPSAKEVEHTRELLSRYFRPTRLVSAESLAQRSGARVHLKIESDLPTGSFKPRGALNALLTTAAQGPVRGVVAASTGNHGAAVAYAARIAKVGATIFLPENPNPVKRARIVALGAKVIERGAMGSSAASEAAAEFAREHGHYFSARPCSRGRCSRSQPLLNNPDGILKKFGWQAARRIPFTNVREIVEMEPILKAYIHEAKEKAGLEVAYKKNPEPVP